MTAENDLFELERQFWSEVADTDFYLEHTTENVVMVFPAPYGIMERDATLAAVAAATRWEACDFTDMHFVDLTEKSAVIAYRADARRRDGSTYSTFAASSYVKRAGSWKLAVHQQTPIPQDV